MTKHDHGDRSMTDSIPRWYYRFDNYRRAFTLLREAIEQENPLTQLEKEGVVFDQITPRAVIRRAFEAGVITQGEIWQTALDARNRMSHTYNFDTFEQVIADIHTGYLAAFDELHEFLLVRRINAGTP